MRGNPIPILHNLIRNADLKPGESPSLIVDDQRESHEVFIKDVEYINEIGEKKKM